MDVFYKIADVKREFIRFCKPFEARLCLNVNSHRVIALVEEQSTDFMIPEFIVDKAARGAKRLGPSKIYLQFLEHHKQNFLGLHHDVARISYSPQTDAALTNFKTLLELEISLLMGCYTEWTGASDFAVRKRQRQRGPFSVRPDKLMMTMILLMMRTAVMAQPQQPQAQHMAHVPRATQALPPTPPHPPPPQRPLCPPPPGPAGLARAPLPTPTTSRPGPRNPGIT